MGFSRNELNARFNLGFDEDEEGDRQYISYNLVPLEAVDLNVPIRELNEPETDSDDEKESKGRFSNIVQLETTKITQGAFPVYKNYYYQQRSKILKKLYDFKDKTVNFSTLIDKISIFENEDRRFVKNMTPYMRDAVETGQKIGLEDAGELVDELILNKELLKKKVNEILGVNKTVLKKLIAELKQGLEKEEDIEQLAERVKEVYNQVRTAAYKLVKTTVHSILMEASLCEMNK